MTCIMLENITNRMGQNSTLEYCVKGIANYGLLLEKLELLDLTCFIDANWFNASNDQRSTSA